MLRYFAPTACARGRFTPAQRLLLCFGILFPLKYGLAFTPLHPVTQIVILTLATTVLVWTLWSAGAANRRVMLAFVTLLWAAAAFKIWRV